MKHEPNILEELDKECPIQDCSYRTSCRIKDAYHYCSIFKRQEEVNEILKRTIDLPEVA